MVDEAQCAILAISCMRLNLAVAAPSRRQRFHVDVGKRAGDEMMAIAWQCSHLGELQPRTLHRGAAPQWIGLTAEPRQAAALRIPPYPYMRKWVRDIEDPASRHGDC